MTPFDEGYYRNRCGGIPYERSSHWLSFFGGIADEIVRRLRPKRVFDAGCAWGFLVESLVDRGIDAYGVDISQYAISQVRPDIRPRCLQASLTDPIRNGPFDLVTCIEVLEHMPADESELALDNLCAVSDQILFSSTPSDLDEPTHINVQPTIHWLRAFAQRGFRPNLAYDASFIAPHAFLVKRGPAEGSTDGLTLLAETLRLRGERAAFLSRHNEILDLRARTTRMEEESAGQTAAVEESRLLLERSERERLSTLDLFSQAQLSLDAARLALDSERAVSERIRKEAESAAAELLRVATERDETARQRDQFSDQTERLRSALGEQDVALARVAEESETWKAQCAKLADEAAQVRIASEIWMASAQDNASALESALKKSAQQQSELLSVRSSPGWQLVLRYRDLLKRLRANHAWFRKHAEPMIEGLLARAGLADNRPIALPESEVALPLPQPVAPVKVHHATTPPAVAVPRPIPVAAEPTARETTYDEWLTTHEPSSQDLQIQERVAHCLSYRPLLSIIVPVYKTPLGILREMIGSVRVQTYEHWELCLAAGEAEDAANLVELRRLSEDDPRIRIRALERNPGISDCSNAALELASGEFVALLDHDDTLAPFALYEIACALNKEPDLSFLYSDKDQITADGSKRLMPLFKPQWSPELMWNANYLTHLCVMRTSEVRADGGWRKETDGAQDWDLFLRVTGRGGKIGHIPKVLYHWRQLHTSVASGGLDAKPYAADGQIRAVTEHCRTRGLDVTVDRGVSGDLHVCWPHVAEQKVSVLLAGTIGRDAFARANALIENTDHPNYEILYGTAESADSTNRLRAIRVKSDASLAEQISKLEAEASGSILVLVDSEAIPAAPSWLSEMTGPLQSQEIGIVGARLVDPDTRVIRHCGLVITPEGNVEAIYSGQPEHVYEIFGGGGWYRNWSAVSGGCMAIRRDTWEQLGGLGGKPNYPRLDVHLCLKLKSQTELRILYNPYATLWCRSEPAMGRVLSRDLETGRMAVRALFPDGDPFFHPELTCRHGRVGFRQLTDRAVAAHDYAAESRMLVQWFDTTSKSVEESRRLTRRSSGSHLRTINWILPEFSNPFYGGVHTILRFANAFRRKAGVESRFCFLGNVATSRMQRLIGAAFSELGDAEVYTLKRVDYVNDLPDSDAAVCTLWTTAYPLVAFRKTRRKFYFMQDDEALFYPAGSTSALVEATYRFGFQAICNTESLLKRYQAAGGLGEYFSPCVDNSVFHGRQRRERRSGEPYTLFCYARPNHPRNCFELVAESLRKLKDRMGERVQILAAGEEWDPGAFGLTGVVQNLGLLDYHATGALYRACDAGTALMMTRHPSYLPLELMACGALVITNRNPDTAWLLRDEENCLLTDPTPSALADRIEAGLLDSAMRDRITARAAADISRQFSNWDAAATRILEYMKRELEKG